MTFGQLKEKIKKQRVGITRAAWNNDKRFVWWEPSKALFYISDICGKHIWYWETADEFKEAVQDINADDWNLVYGI